MRGLRLPTWFVLIGALLLAFTREAGAADEKKTEARKLYDEATAAFGVGNYAEAAERYEGSFKLHPDPALLYNAAQAYRLAGNQARALQLYRNFLRLYGGNPRAEDARSHVAALEKAAAAAGPAPPPATGEPARAPAPVPLPAGSLNASAPKPEPQPVMIERSAAPPAGGDEHPSLVSRPWFWVAVGVAVLGGTVAVLAATRKDTYPDPSLGTLD